MTGQIISILLTQHNSTRYAPEATKNDELAAETAGSPQTTEKVRMFGVSR